MAARPTHTPLHKIYLDQALIRLKLAAQDRPVEALAALVSITDDLSTILLTITLTGSIHLDKVCVK
jgi:hypothetical protein